MKDFLGDFEDFSNFFRKKVAKKLTKSSKNMNFRKIQWKLAGCSAGKIENCGKASINFMKKLVLFMINIDHYTYGDFHVNHIILPLSDDFKDNY